MKPNLRAVAPRRDTRAKILVTTEIADVTDSAIAALAHDADVYQQGGHLAHVVRVTDAESGTEIIAGTPQIRRMAPATLLERLSRVAQWTKRNEKGDKPTVPPKDIVNAVMARGPGWSLAGPGTSRWSTSRSCGPGRSSPCSHGYRT